MTKKIFRSIVLVATSVLLASLVIILSCFYDYFARLQKQQLKDELYLAAVSVEESGVLYLQNLSSESFRLTLVAKNGSVIYDTAVDAKTLEDHTDREEIKEAFETGRGESVRYSSTMLEKTIYCAKRLSDGSVLRISVNRATVGAIALGMVSPVIAVGIGALILSGVLASRLSKRIVAPLNRLDLEHPLENDSYEELSPLLSRINKQRAQISEQLSELRHKTEEFEQITDNMKEGLVLIDRNENVVSINPAAKKIFSATDDCTGKSFLTVDRSRDFNAAIKSAFENGHSEIRSQKDGRTYQFDISRIDSEECSFGAVILAFDITEHENSEKARREFTANVSHELKTPLQGIIGSAELIENGLVKQEDMPRFVGHIRTEAQRLVNLVNDIIRLSQLDEGVSLPKEHVDLLAVAKEAARDLDAAAADKKVSLSVEGESVFVDGIKRLLYEIVYNLGENAVKYNVKNGNVVISVAAKDKNAVLTVSDSGIGIAPEHQNRIFERFYRVDKSHSKASGGTGLGLSIVKHAVLQHGGKTEVESEPGKGTVIRVILPLAAK